MTKISLDQKDLNEKMAATINRLIEERGFLPPIYFAQVSANGQLLFGKFYQPVAGSDDMDVEFIAEHLTDSQGLRLPLNVMFTDESGKGQLVTFDADGETLN